MAPWTEGTTAAPEGRINAYFRPEFTKIEDWLTST
jgi:hypothetical protein